MVSQIIFRDTPLQSMTKVFLKEFAKDLSILTGKPSKKNSNILLQSINTEIFKICVLKLVGTNDLSWVLRKFPDSSKQIFVLMCLVYTPCF